MDVTDFWPENPPRIPTYEIWGEMICMRETTFVGFATIEKDKGFIQPKVSLSTTHGQEIVRILAMRCLEELAEAYDAEDERHFYEELIDSFNYLCSMFLLDGFDLDRLVRGFMDLTLSFGQKGSEFYLSPSILPASIGHATILLGGHLGDVLRNRAWMHQSQSTYFDGDLWAICSEVFRIIFSHFPSFSLFWSYYIAKDRVLQFRLKSKY